jgi:hypothetical protein
MTLNEIAYNLLNIIRGGRSNHDEHISLDQIKFNIKHYRAMFLRRDFARNGLTTRHVEQDLGCLQVYPTDASRCCDLDIGCTIYKTRLEIPKTVRFNFKDAITYVGDVTGLGTIPMVESHIVRWLPYDKYTKDKMKAFMIDNFMYIHNAKGLEYINVRGVFEDPEDLRLYNCGADVCYDDSATNFPMPMDMIQAINSGIVSGELGLLTSSFSDLENDRMQDDRTVKGIAPQQNKQQQ